MWAASMGWLAVHDILPTLTAGDPPRIQSSDWSEEGTRETEYVVLLDNDEIGTIWTTYRVDVLSVQRMDYVLIERFPIPIHPLHLAMTSTFTPDGLLDEFTVRVRNESRLLLELHGERFQSDFSFTLGVGTHEQAFKVPLADGSLFTGGFNPFSRLANIQVGQSWRVQVFNPVSVITGAGPRFHSMLVRVTGRERVTTAGGAYDCLVVEAPNARAWIDDRGDVVMQEMVLPVSGTLRFVRNAFVDSQSREKAFRF